MSNKLNTRQPYEGSMVLVHEPKERQPYERLLPSPTLQNLSDSFTAADIRDNIACVLTCLSDSEYFNESLERRERTNLITFCLQMQETLLNAIESNQ